MKRVVKKVCVFLCVSACCTALKGDNERSAGVNGTSGYQGSASHVDRQQVSNPLNLNRYLEEVSLTESGLTNFFKCYNNPFYSRRFLPSCFVHITDFLRFLPGQTDPWSYVTTVFSMFLTKMKGCGWTK